MLIEIRKGATADTEGFITFLEDVRSKMEHKEWFYLDPPEFVREAMERGTMELWLALDGQRIAAALDVLRPGLDAYNYGYDLDFSEEELLQVIHMDSAAVRSDYRGLGLQRRLMETAEEILAREGAHILLCTVHPENQFSLNNALKEGYAIQRKLEKYNSVRYLLRKDIFR